MTVKLQNYQKFIKKNIIYGKIVSFTTDNMNSNIKKRNITDQLLPVKLYSIYIYV